MSTKRIKLVVAYDGTEFRGWAAQPEQRTVQRTLKEAVRQISGEDCEIVGASRTDSGAHAKGQVCHFDVGAAIEPERWSEVLNRSLPLDLSVLESAEVERGFHSRFCAEFRHYRYRILQANRDPLRMRYAHYHWRKFDAEAMNEAGRMLVGKHDFRGYSQDLDASIINTERELYSVEVTEANDEIWIDVKGNAFVKGMMRRISGMLYEVGLGKRPICDAAELLTDRGRRELQWPEVLPARGLTLVNVIYGVPPRDFREQLQSDFENDE